MTSAEGYVAMLVLSWNLFHGRAVPEEPRDLCDAFATQLAAWPWDVALLQEVPPWWPPLLGGACRASVRTALTSRNWLNLVTRPLARWRPDLVKSWGGGANAILVRGERIVEHRTARLRSWPERRVVHAVRLQRGWWVANLHGQAHREGWALADLAHAAAMARAWSGDAPLVLGGDLNLRQPVVPGLTHVAGHSVDHLFVRGLQPCAPGRRLERGRLSDHVPIVVDVARKDLQETAS